jgi:predicted transcriptional regulator
MEGTSQTKVIIPIIITVICARSVGDLFSDGIYEIGIELKEYPYLRHGEKTTYDSFRAADVMRKDFHYVGLVETVGFLEKILCQTDDQAFPVVDDNDRQYLGIIRRDQIIAVLRCRIYIETMQGGSDDDGSSTDDAELGTHGSRRTMGVGEAPVTLSPWLRDNIRAMKTKKGTKLLYGVDETLPVGSTLGDRAILKDVDGKQVVYVPDKEKNQHVDIGSLMNKAAMSVATETPLSKTCNAFATLGLRHLPVLTPGGLVAGIITRQELSEERITAMMGKKLR